MREDVKLERETLVGSFNDNSLCADRSRSEGTHFLVRNGTYRTIIHDLIQAQARSGFEDLQQ